jgi:pSer/pThr/pTyr-binding forkhead associated (FHA) protein
MQLGNPDGLTAAELNMVQARMLMNTGIPHHLRLLLREVDLQVTLEYAVSRRKMLSHLLKSERMSMSDFFGLLLQMARGIEEGRLYMLRAEQYALHEDYIFVEGPLSSGKVYLTYIPLKSVGAASPGESMKSLIMVLMASVTELAGSGVQRLLQYCGSEDFTPSGLKDLLAELLADGIPVKGVSGTTESVPPDFSLNRAAPVTAETFIKQKPHVNEAKEAAAPRGWSFAQMQENRGGADQTEASPWMNSIPKLRLKEEEEAIGAGDVRKDTDSPPSAYRTYTALGAVLADALLWKFLYLDNPNLLWLLVDLIATLILAVLCWMVWSERIMIGRNKAEEEDAEELEAADAKTDGRWQSRKPKELDWEFGRNPVVPIRTATHPRVEQEVASPAYTDNSDMRRRAAAEDKPQPAAEAATALLTRSSAPGSEREPAQPARTTPYLERSQTDEGGTPEKIELSRGSFIIGRSPEVAQYVEKSEGASRVHAEISRGPAGYILKDLDSRNGTLYQGEPMIPYKEYPLAEGSVFTIVKGSYTFRSA